MTGRPARPKCVARAAEGAEEGVADEGSRLQVCG
jgi:hypothetical protein